MSIETDRDSIEFTKRVKFALRYNSTPLLPLASMYAAVGDTRRAIELTNSLLARKEVVETNVIAGRLVLVLATSYLPCMPCVLSIELPNCPTTLAAL